MQTERQSYEVLRTFLLVLLPARKYKTATESLSGAQHAYRQFPAIGHISQRSLPTSPQNAY